MYCDSCRIRPSLVVVQEVVNNSVNEVHLCLQCAAKLGITPPVNGGSPLSYISYIGSLAERVLSLQKSSLDLWSSKKCNNCGLKGEELIKSGIAGCKDCYTVFDELISFGRNRSNVPSYKGRLPEQIHSKKDNRNKIRTLKKELKELVRSEKYKEAAELRDRIKEISTGSGER